MKKNIVCSVRTAVMAVLCSANFAASADGVSVLQGDSAAGWVIRAIPDQVVTGEPILVTPTVEDAQTGEIVDPANYDVVCSNNEIKGTATVTVTGKGACVGMSASGSYSIVNPPGVSGTVYFAAPGGSAEADGRTVKEAGSLTRVFALATSSKGNAVYLEDGTYDYTTGLSDDRDSFFTNNVTLLIASRSDNRDACIIRGGGKEKLIRFVRLGARVYTTFRSLTFDGCSATEGGIFYVTDFNVTMTNCVARNCYASNRGGVGYVKGDWNQNNGGLYGCEFLQNYAGTGYSVLATTSIGPKTYGCEFVSNSVGPTASATIGTIGTRMAVCNSHILHSVGPGPAISTVVSLSNCVFVGNMATNGNGGVASRSGDFSITDCHFTNNYSKTGGATIHNTEGNGHDQTYITRCTFYGNKTDAAKSPFYVQRYAYFDSCTFVSNTCASGGWACGSHYSGGWAVDCLIEGNEHARGLKTVNATNCVVKGGDYAISGGSATRCRFFDTTGEDGISFSDTTLRDSLVSGCHLANYNGGRMMKSVNAYNCTIVGSKGGRANDWNNTLVGLSKLVNCILDNPDIVSSEIMTQSGVNYAVYATNCVYRTGGAASLLVNCKTVSELTAAGTPLRYVGTGDEPYALRRLSYGVDGGFDYGIPAAAADLTGASRLYGAAVDIGCYEWHPSGGFILFIR